MYILLVSVVNFFKVPFIVLVSSIILIFSRYKAVYFFLRFSGPTFVKLGQLLSTRSDLVGDELSNILSIFQDKLPPFQSNKVKKIIQCEFKKKLNDIFSDFILQPVACASIAQVHKAVTGDGNSVAVKILRPNIRKLMKIDIVTLNIFSIIIGIFSRYYKRKMVDIIELLKNSSDNELNLLNEASAASQLKDNLKNLEGIYIPTVYWSLTTNKVLVMEWIDGIAFSNKQGIHNCNFDKNKIAHNLVICYFHQIYVDGFFHADMHPGNLLLMKNGDIAIVDFGIVGIIDHKMRIAIAEILIGFLQKDYKKVAKVHIENGLVPSNTDIVKFSLACRIIGESVVGLSVKQISLVKLLDLLMKTTKKYNMDTRSEFLLLQKTMMLVEGVGMELNNDLNMWDIARPWVKEWAVKNIGFDAKIRDNVLDLLKILKRLSNSYNQ